MKKLLLLALLLGGCPPTEAPQSPPQGHPAPAGAASGKSVSLDAGPAVASPTGPSAAPASPAPDLRPKPTLLLLVAEQIPSMPAPFGWWLPALSSAQPKAGPSSLRVFTDGFTQLLQERGWRFAHQDDDAVRAVHKKHPIGVDLPDSQALAIARLGGVDVVVVGEVTTSSPGPSEASAGMMTAQAHVALRALDVKTGDGLVRFDESIGDITTMDTSADAASRKALRLAGPKAAQKIADALMTHPWPARTP